MKQTAVEWLEKELKAIRLDVDKNVLKFIDKSFEIAKEIEKQHHKETWFESTSQFSNEAEMLYKKDFEQYYNEKFNK